MADKEEDTHSDVVADEVLRDRTRKLIDEPKPDSTWHRISTNPLTLVIVGFILTGLVGTYLTHVYDVKQKAIEFQRVEKQKEIEFQRAKDQKAIEFQRDKNQREIEAQRTADQKAIEFQRDKNQRQIEAQRQRNDKIVAQQFEVVESLTKISFDYFIAAQFVKLDFQQGQPEQDLLQRHLADYDRTAKETLSGYLLTAFKVRMYFDDPVTYSELNRLWLNLAILDGRIVRALNLQKNVPTPTAGDSEDRWLNIGGALDSFISENKVVLDKLYKRIGKLGAAEEYLYR